MKSRIALAVVIGCAAAAAVAAQSPSSAFPRGNSQQAWQNPGLPAVLAKCKTKPAPFGIPVSTAPQPATPPAEPPPPPSTAIPNVVAAGADVEDRLGTGKATMLTAPSPATPARCCSPTTTPAT